MEINELTCLILSCDKFSDLWSGNIKLFNKNWPNREFETYIVTDKPSNATFDNVKILAAGESVEWSDRLAFALNHVKTKYVFVTLDDYYLIKPVPIERINTLLEYMKQKSVDYIRLFPDPQRATTEAIEEIDKLYKINNNIEYSVNLYAGIWDVGFLKYCIGSSQDAWHFEVSLRSKAIKKNASCLVSLMNEYAILDVVRKGKLLHKAVSFFKKNPGIYEGQREINSRWYEFKIKVKAKGKELLPTALVPIVRKVLIKMGVHFYSVSE